MHLLRVYACSLLLTYYLLLKYYLLNLQQQRGKNHYTKLSSTHGASEEPSGVTVSLSKDPVAINTVVTLYVLNSHDTLLTLLEEMVIWLHKGKGNFGTYCSLLYRKNHLTKIFL